MRFGILCLFSFCSLFANADVVEFYIQQNTAKSSWNSQETPITVKIGDVLRLINNDDVQHRLHTFGAPCSHGPDIAPGASWDCNITKYYSSAVSGPLYDHYYGPDAAVWIEVIEE